MILLDTNVLSEPLTKHPDGNVLQWLKSQKPSDIATTAISIGELYVGMSLLPLGKRRTMLYLSIETITLRYDGRILDYDAHAAQLLGRVRELSRDSGRTMTVEDAMIAAICLRERAALATRNTRDFEHVGIKLINPWQ